mgnify:CR=1 FL=1
MGFTLDDLTPKRPATAVTPVTDFPDDNTVKPEETPVQNTTTEQVNNTAIDTTATEPVKNTAIDITGITGNVGHESFAEQPTEAVTKITPNTGITIDWSKPYAEIEQNPILQQMKPYDIMRDYQKNGDGNWSVFLPWLNTLGDGDKTVAANEALKKKEERKAKWEQWGNFLMHLGNFIGTTQGAPSQKIESAQELTDRQRKIRESTDALRQKGYDQMMVNIWKDRQNKQAQMQAEAAAKANEALAAYRGSQKAQVDALTPAKVEEVNQSARQHSTGADLNISKKETEDALRGKKGKLLDAQTNNANAGADDKRSHIGVNNSTIAKNNAQTQKTNRENADNKEADDFNTNYVNDPVFKKHVNEWATHNGMNIGGNIDGRGGTWANKYNRQQASAYAKAKMAKEGKKRTVRPYGGKPAKRTSSTKVDYSKYIRK